MSVISIDRKKLQKGAIRHLRDRTPFNPLQEVEEAMRQLPYQKQGVCAARLILEGVKKQWKNDDDVVYRSFDDLRQACRQVAPQLGLSNQVQKSALGLIYGAIRAC